MLSIMTIIFCGIFSPVSLIFSIPALLLARKVSLQWLLSLRISLCCSILCTEPAVCSSWVNRACSFTRDDGCLPQHHRHCVCLGVGHDTDWSGCWVVLKGLRVYRKRWVLAILHGCHSTKAMQARVLGGFE